MDNPIVLNCIVSMVVKFICFSGVKIVPYSIAVVIEFAGRFIKFVVAGLAHLLSLSHP